MPAKYSMDEYDVVVIYDRPVSDKGGAEFESSMFYDEGEAFADACKYVDAGKCGGAKVYRYNGTTREYLLSKSPDDILGKCTLIGEVDGNGVVSYGGKHEGRLALTYGEFLNESAAAPRIELECTCADITESEWNELMKGRRKYPYDRLVNLIREQHPELYRRLNLDLRNPWAGETFRTRTHLILTQSAIEYFFRIVG